MKTLNELIIELQKYQAEGKGEYRVREPEHGEDLLISYIDDHDNMIWF